MSKILAAYQWFQNGDHPQDECRLIFARGGKEFLSEGKVVRRYRTPEVRGATICPLCGNQMTDHGWIDVPEDGLTVCPGDWVITDSDGNYYPQRPKVFEADL